MSFEIPLKQQAIGSGEGQQFITADTRRKDGDSAERRNARVKSLSASALGSKIFPLPPRTGTGVGDPAPSFSASLTPRDIALLQLQMRPLDQIEAELERERAKVRLGSIRRECERANRAEHRFILALWWGGGYAAFATAAAGYVLYLYLWGAR